jgi:hypothetical protein
MTNETDDRLTREDACRALGIAPEAFERLESIGILSPDADGRYHPLAIAASFVRFGLERAQAADRKLAEVGAALGAVKPALERLAGLPDRAGLSGDAHGRAMVEVAAFFSAFAQAMNRATAALEGEEPPRPGA